MSLLISVVAFLIFLCFVMLAYHLLIWVFGRLGITIPAFVLQIAMVILVLICIYAFLTGGMGGLTGLKFGHLTSNLIYLS